MKQAFEAFTKTATVLEQAQGLCSILGTRSFTHGYQLIRIARKLRREYKLMHRGAENEVKLKVLEARIAYLCSLLGVEYELDATKTSSFPVRLTLPPLPTGMTPHNTPEGEVGGWGIG